MQVHQQENPKIIMVKELSHLNIEGDFKPYYHYFIIRREIEGLVLPIWNGICHSLSVGHKPNNIRQTKNKIF